MAATTKIEWATATWNPWIGCTKVSEACRFCYAERGQADWLKRVKWGPDGTRGRTSEKNWRQLERWNTAAACLQTFDCANAFHGDHADCCPQAAAVRPRVFVGSLCDLFEDWPGPIHDHQGRQLFTINGCEVFTEGEYPECRAVTMDDLRAELWPILERCTNMDFLLLTKRPENALRMVPDHWLLSWPGNVWIGTTVEDQQAAEQRISHLLRLPAPVRFLSMEPLLGPVDLRKWLPAGRANLHCSYCGGFQRGLGDCVHCGGDVSGLTASHAANIRKPAGSSGSSWTNRQPLDWIIAGGESGPRARPSNPDWFFDVRDVATAAGVPFLFKQWGEWRPAARREEPARNMPFGPREFGGLGAVDTDAWKGGFAVWTDRETWAYDGSPNARPDWHHQVMARVGKAAAGNHLDGRQWLQIPRPVDRNLLAIDGFSRNGVSDE